MARTAFNDVYGIALKTAVTGPRSLEGSDRIVLQLVGLEYMIVTVTCVFS